VLVRADGSFRSLLARLSHIHGPVIDDWVMARLSEPSAAASGSSSAHANSHLTASGDSMRKPPVTNRGAEGWADASSGGAPCWTFKDQPRRIDPRNRLGREATKVFNA